MAAMGHHRERQRGQHSLQQYEIIITEAVRQIARKRIADAGAVGSVPIRTEADDLREIIGSAGGGEIFENGKIEQRFGSGETPTQVLPGISVWGGRFRLAGSDSRRDYSVRSAHTRRRGQIARAQWR